MEIAFRDAYLTRGDMWRLVISELADRSIYKGQRLVMMGTIKARVKTIYIKGQKVSSALFGSHTKPVFRSESARYVLFIQMSKEMWDFDTDGTGEIMFHKVKNGFLPELFKRWGDIGARHLVSIILFTRLEYDKELGKGFDRLGPELQGPNMRVSIDDKSYQDFYRVLVSDLASGIGPAILEQLKQEFKVFLRDVSMCNVPTEQLLSSSEQSDKPKHIIAGRPTSATRGNILEAINLALSQFSDDYIDKDLGRTGLSITIITPGTGVFEVDHKLLSVTTDLLIENGISIDLVCLSRMPLHSVPLFKYRHSRGQAHKSELNRGSAINPRVLDDGAGSLDSLASNGTLSEVSSSEYNPRRVTAALEHQLKGRWHYGVPHWVDISFWTGLAEQSTPDTPDRKSAVLNRSVPRKCASFVPRVRMYELQMMGVMENEMSNIKIPNIRQTSSGASLQSDAALLRSRQSSMSIRDFLLSDASLDRKDSLGIHSMQSLSVSPSQETNLEKYGTSFQWMDEYDKMVFSYPWKKQKARRQARNSNLAKQRAISSNVRSYRPFTSSSPSLRNETKNSILPILPQTPLTIETHGPQSGQFGLDRICSAGSIDISNTNRRTRPKKLARHISFSLRGFGGPPKAAASTEITVEHAQSASRLIRNIRPEPSIKSANNVLSTLSETENSNTSSSELEEYESSKAARISTSAFGHKSSSPIAINRGIIKGSSGTYKPRNGHVSEELDKGLAINQDDIISDEPLNENKNSVVTGSSMALSPQSAMAPWLTILNPSNPRKIDINLASRLGRWHHVFPRPLRASNIKWKSLCSPASVPLTTEDFPSTDQLFVQYVESSYEISQYEEDGISEEPKNNEWLFRELLYCRLSHGFQIVVGSRLAESIGDSALENPEIFNDKLLCSQTITVSKGGTIHRITMAENGTSIQVKSYKRRPMSSIYHLRQETTSIVYKSAVRTTLGERYDSREVVIGTPRDAYDWQRVDQSIASQDEPQDGRNRESSRFWEARFVLIPVDPPVNPRRSTKPLNEDSKEEVRLEGIRRLAMLFQKFRAANIHDHLFPAGKPKDTNPLDIMYQTRSPSEVVTAELDRALLAETEPVTKTRQLLPDSDLYQRAGISLHSLAQTMQGERGVRMMDRRWHLRLHYSCFIGIEFVTWLLDNVRDVETRDDAVELGNTLMRDGLFQHVEGRHALRDGNYFYQIASEYRMPRSESHSSWFRTRKPEASVPSTPNAEGLKESTTRLYSSSGTDRDGTSDTNIPTSGSKAKIRVSLSEKLIYDVDHRKRSYRKEFINLHYDRVAQADDTYHIRIDWLNVTPKLIEDAIMAWALCAGRFGLCLVGLPVGEASKINKIHPLTAPYLVKLARSPPDIEPKNYFDSSSFTPQARSSFPYQKAILKRFDFVLDLEAAKDFPANVDVSYSWGQPDYQFTQYISRSGTLLAQINDGGDFLLLANRLYSHRNTTAGAEITAMHETLSNQHWLPARGSASASTLGISPRLSPFASPIIHATPDVGPRFARSKLVVTPEKIIGELEKFCHDPDALERFFDEVQSSNVPSSPDTPLIADSVATLGVPPNLNLQERFPVLNTGSDGGVQTKDFMQ